MKRYLPAFVLGLLFGPNPASAHDLRVPFAAVLRTPNTCPSVTPAGPFGSPAPGYKPKYQTIAHRFLDNEVGAGDVTPEMYAILDTLIDQAVAQLQPYSVGLAPAQAKIFAVETLKAIDCILLRHGFVYPAKGLVALLSDGLGPTIYDNPADLLQLRQQQHNVRRNKFMDVRGSGPYYVVDCDVASYIYLAIAEVMKYPMHLVEIPRHNFIRWILDATSFVNFETMDGFATDDMYYRTHWGIDDRFVGIGGILETMNEKQTRAYHYASVALSWSWRGNIPQMIAFYEQSVATDSTHSFALNNLAWFYAAVPNVALRDGAKAVRFGLQSVAVLKDGDTLDTLACAYAQSGDFTRAIETELSAIDIAYAPFGSSIGDDLALFRASPPQTCNDSGFGKDPQPFRPGQTMVRAATDKELMRLH
jgi:hypothetical protein